jgi:hypothetical protein
MVELSSISEGNVSTNVLYPGLDYSLPAGFGTGTAAAINAAMASCSAAGGGIVYLPAVDISLDATIDNKYPKVLLQSVSDVAHYIDSGSTDYACRLLPTFAGTVLKHRTPLAAELGGTPINKYWGGGFSGISVFGNSIATRLLEVNTIAGGIYRLFLQDCVGSICAYFYCGVGSTDILGSSSIQYMKVCDIAIRQLASGAAQLCDAVTFDNAGTGGNVSLNDNIRLDIEHHTGKALDIISGDNNHIWIRANNAAGSGYAVYMHAPTAVHTTGGHANTFRYISSNSDGAIFAEGTDTAGATAAVNNTIEYLDTINGSPTPTAGTGTIWRYGTGHGDDANMSVSKMTVADTVANARAQRLNQGSASLRIYSSSNAHLNLADGTNTWLMNINSSTGDIAFQPTVGAGANFGIGGMNLKANSINIVEGISVPSAQSGRAIEYVDGADSSQKMRYADGSTRRITQKAAVAATVNTDANFTLTPGTSQVYTKHTGTLTADRTITLSTTNVVNGDKFVVFRTGSGAFNLSVGGLKNLATGQWAEVIYDGSAWGLAKFGSL